MWHDAWNALSSLWARAAPRHAVAVGPRAGKFARVRDLEHRVPVDRGIVFRGRRRARGCHRAQVDDLSGYGLDFWRVDEPVAAHPHLVARLRKFGQDIAAVIVGDHDLRELGRQVAGLRDHPDTGFRPTPTADHAAPVTRP